MIEIVKIKKAYNFIMSFLLFAGMGRIVALLLMIFSKDFIADVESVITMVLVFFFITWLIKRNSPKGFFL